MYEYVANALYSADANRYRTIHAELNSATRGELSAYNRFYEKYRNSAASKVSTPSTTPTCTPSRYLTAPWSYGMVVDLTVAWYKAYPEK